MNFEQSSIFDFPAEMRESRKVVDKAFEEPRSFSSNVIRINTPVETVQESIQRVYDNSSDEWRTKASEIVHGLCQTHQQFDLDHVAEAFAPIDHLPHKPRALGGVMLRAVKDKWCRITGYEKSKRKSRHFGVIAVYQSLLFR